MIKKLSRLFVVSAMILIIILSVLGLHFYSFTRNPLPVGSGYVLVITPGTSVQKIAEQLVENGILHSTGYFLVCVKYKGAWNLLKAGEYLIKPGTTPIELIEQLRDGKVIQHALTIVPGWTFEQLMVSINQEPKLTHTLNGLKPEEIMTKLGYPGLHPEARFLADTYYFPAGTTDVQFLKRAYSLLDLKLKNIWAGRAESLPLKSAYQALILASIIEKESNVPDEYAEIAGVYTRRLEKNMPLQADPTVVYGAGSSYKGRITKEMLKAETPYNTYQMTGLPPTPIAFPSVKALEAAVHPKAGETLYFVAKADGKRHEFSKTIEEHLLAVARYRRASIQETDASGKLIEKPTTQAITELQLQSNMEKH